ncbi:MAG: hypothetical protein ACR2QG_09055 [Gammaproteobacteria bacterium]
MNKTWLYAFLISLIAIPVIIYIGGSIIVGPYEGQSGLIGMMGNIYVDALRLKLSAWVLLLSPLLLVAIWKLCFRLRRIIPS